MSIKPLLLVSALVILVSTLLWSQSAPRPLAGQHLAQSDLETQAKVSAKYGKLPLSFEANNGQTDPHVRFLSRGSSFTLFLTRDEAIFSFGKRRYLRNVVPLGLHVPINELDHSGSLRMKLVDANRATEVIGTDELTGKSNYLIGNNSKVWRTNVPLYQRVLYKAIYPGIDLTYYSHQRQLEYDFIVSPGSDPRLIRFNVRGAHVRKEKNGDLSFESASQEFRWQRPRIYQEKDGERKEIEGKYIINRNGQLTFAIGNYDKRSTLVIDPALTYSTYLGGGNYDEGYGVAVDSSRNVYISGYTQSVDFPVTSGSTQGQYGGGGSDAFVTKLDPTLSSLIYSTYLGGNDFDQSYNVAVDASGSAYVVGSTQSANFPTTSGSFEPNLRGFVNGFISKLSPDGSSLVYSTYLGGSGVDRVGGIALGPSKDAYVAGVTQSSDFPTTPGAYQTSCPGQNCGLGNAFITHFNPSGSALVYSTFVGGSEAAGAAGIALDTSGNTYITGDTYGDYPTTPGAFQSQPGGAQDGFITKMNSTGSALIYSTYLGGSASESSNAIAIDFDNNAYVTGLTESVNFPVTPGAFQTTCGDCGDDGGNMFVTKLSVDGSSLIYSTFLGGTIGYQEASGVAVDSSGNAYVVGSGGGDIPITPGAFQTQPGGGYLSEMSADGSALIYSSYLGGPSDFVGHVTLDSSGALYLVGTTSSSSFPVTPGAYQPTCAANCIGSDAFVTKFVPGDQIWPFSLNFGEEALGGTTKPQIAILTNSEKIVLSINSVAITGPNSNDFAQSNNCGQSLAPGSSCTISVTFTPLASGPLTAQVTVTDNAANSPQIVNLSGAGGVSIVTLSPQSLNFGNQTVGLTSKPLPVILSTSGPLNISSITTTLQFAQTNNCGSSLPAGGECTIDVTFTPSSVGQQNGNLAITDDGEGSPQFVPLAGVGAQPTVVFSPPNLNFGNQTVGISSIPLTATLENTGAGTLLISSIVLAGANSHDYDQANNCGASLLPGGSCTFTVVFRPSALGRENASINIADNAPNSPQALPLAGTGVLPAVSFSPATLVFPNQVVYTKSPIHKLTLTNTGLGTLKITSGKISGQFGETNDCKPTIAPGVSCTINVIFKPTDKGVLGGAISVADNAPGSPQKVPLSGTGTFVQLKPLSVNFGNQPVHTTSLPKYITFTNQGTATVNITSIVSTGTNSGDFTVTNNCGNSVAVGASCFIKVRFTPSAQGKRTADVSITDDGGGSPQTVPLIGVGTP